LLRWAWVAIKAEAASEVLGLTDVGGLSNSASDAKAVNRGSLRAVGIGDRARPFRGFETASVTTAPLSTPGDRTVGFYDRRNDQVTLDQVERIVL
jgi:hypothetical protein